MRLAVLASGGGSNLQAILDAIASGELAATPALVLSDRDDAGALSRAGHHGVPTAVVRPSDFAGPEPFGEALLQELAARSVDHVALAGYMRQIPAGVVAAFRHRMLNVHPSLLPAFGGKGLYLSLIHI